MRAWPWLAAFALGGCNLLLGNGGAYRTGPSPDAGADAGRPTLDAYVDPCIAMGLPPTSLSGKVYAPNGRLPLNGAAVYVPSAPLDPIPDGVSATTCVSGSPLAVAHSDEAGDFHIAGVPSGNVPLVVQIGKWRREHVLVTGVRACTDNTVDASLTRLPANASEGTLPHIAITTGSADTMECIARDVGIDPSEIGTGGTFTGHVHLYVANGTAQLAAPTQNLDAAIGLFTPNVLVNYDVIMLSCTGAAMTSNAAGPLAANLRAWTDLGGWLFLDHYNYQWLSVGPAPWPQMAVFQDMSVSATAVASVDTSSAIGASYAKWLEDVGVLTSGQMAITNARNSCRAIDSSQCERRLYLDPALNAGISGTQAFVWHTTNGGRVTFDDVHVGGNANPALQYPNECSLPLPQETALMFQLFEAPTCE